MQKAAIVIGVDRTGHLPVLAAAVSGAAQVADWLHGEGFTVRRFLDERTPVTAAALYQAVAELVDRGTLEQLVVYFSGHGFLNNGSEHWMLSGAPADPNQAVSLRESVELARTCGIPSVVFVSDACRSVPTDLRADRVRGSLIFPNLTPGGAVEPEIDRFLASLPGDPALELPLADSSGQFQGLYTACFLEAFRRPDPEMVQTLAVEGQDLRVVPNRNLKSYLRREVNRLAQAKSIKLRQLPESIVESGERCYLGRAAGTPGPAQPDATARAALPVPPTLTIGEVARAALFAAEGIGPGPRALNPQALDRDLLDLEPVEPAPAPVSRPAPETAPAAPPDLGAAAGPEPVPAADPGALAAFDDSVAAAAAGLAPDHFETRMGLAVTGAEVVSALGVGVGAELLPAGPPGSPALIRLHPGNRPAGSVLLRFGDGSGTLVAALDGYIGSLVLDRGGLINLSYVPSSNSWRWADYQQERPRLERLRALTAAAARLGVFRVERTEAGALADAIRYLKCIDPTLGLYAAYAYADAGLTKDIRSVQEYSRGDLGADLFDIALLAGSLSAPARLPLVPACPMLAQGFTLLRVRGVHLPPALAAAAEHLRTALWTTFEPAGTDLIEAAIHQGELR